MKSSNYYLVGFIGLAIAISTYFYIKPEKTIQKPTYNAGVPFQEKEALVVDAIKPSTKQTTDKVIESSVFHSDENLQIEERIHEQSRHLYETGQDSEKQNEYESYSKETLETLSESLDIYALNALGLLYHKDGDTKKAKETFEKALIQGNIAAVYGLSLIYHGSNEYKDQYYDKYGFQKGRHILSIERAAYEILASKVGAIRAKNVAEGMDAQDYADASKMADEIYQKLMKEREKLGLGKFPQKVSLAKK